jgi:hypothetical protein
MHSESREIKKLLASVFEFAHDIVLNLFVFAKKVGGELLAVVTSQIAPPLLLDHADVHLYENILGKEVSKSLIATHKDPSAVYFFGAELEVGSGGFTKRERAVVRVVVEHSKDDIAVGSALDLFNLVHHVVFISEGQCSEEEEEVHSILVTDETTGSQKDLQEKSQDISLDIRDV